MSVYDYSYRGLSSFPGLVDQPSSTPSKSPNPAKNKDSASAPAARGLNPAPTQSKDAVSQRGGRNGKDSKGDIGDIGDIGDMGDIGATVSDAFSSPNYGMIGTALSFATGIPALGFIGYAIDTVNDMQGEEGNEGRAEGAGEGGASSSSTAGGYGGSSGLGGPAGGFEGTAAASGEGGGGGKMACTAMNTEYGFGSFRQSIWLRQSKDLHPAYQRGYHAIFGPLVKRAYQDDGSPRLRAVLEHIARRRTADIWKQRRGRRDPIGMIERAILEPLCYIVGRLS